MSIKQFESFLWKNVGAEDEVSLIQQLFEAYGEETDHGTLALIDNFEAERFVQRSPDICGFRDEITLKVLEISKALFPIDPKTYPYFDKLIGARIYKVSMGWLCWYCNSNLRQ